MTPEQSSPYWRPIVGDNWPEISPGDWRGLEETARNGADAIDPVEADRARRAFDDQVVASNGLQPVKDDMLAQRGTPQAFVDALVAAADTYGRIADLVHRTRNRILDIVDEATRAIGRVQAESSDSDDDGEQKQRRIAGIVEDARRAVADCVAKAIQEIGPQGLPELSLIADVLGEPSPWGSGPSGHPGGPGNDGPTGYPGGPLPPSAPGVAPVGAGTRPTSPGAPPPTGGVPNESSSPSGDPQQQGPGGETNTPDDGAIPQGSPPTVPAVSPAAAQQPGPGMSDAPGAGALPGGDQQDLDGPSHPDEPSHAPSRDGADDGREHEAGDNADRGGPETDTAPSGSDVHDAGPRSGGVGATESVESGAPMLGAPIGFIPPPTGSGGMTPPAGTSPGTAGAPPDRARSISAPETKGPPPVDSRIAADSKAAGPDSRTAAPDAKGPPGSGPSSGRVSAPAGKQPPDRPQSSPDRADNSTGTTGSTDNQEHDGNMVRDAVGAAMMASAGPAFVVGKKVNGDLVLARSLLAGLLAAAESMSLGVAWAVSIMRHAGGVSAFVTSNEGRGWLPSGVFLPRELSTPWVWSVSQHAPWEGLADPARILLEFAAAWGVKSGAETTALASSEPIDAAMVRQMGDIAAEGSVAAAPDMDFTTVSSGSEDRLGLVGAPKLLEQVASVRPERIRGRCLELAADAHVRVGKLDAGDPRSMGVPALRERILVEMQRGQAVPEQWWEELRDADDLVAASVIPLRADVSRIAVGQLRGEASDSTGSETAAVRRLAFERRCDELVLLLSTEPTRQCLRDTVYAHGQVVDHPLFAGIAAAAAADAAARQRSVISTGPDRRR